MIETLPVVEDCEKCGACCNQHSLPPYSRVVCLHRELLDDSEQDLAIISWFNGLPSELRHQLRSESDRTDKPCLWLTAEKCKHYEHRPPACREFPVGGKWCHIHRREAGIEKR